MDTSVQPSSLLFPIHSFHQLRKIFLPTDGKEKNRACVT